LLRRKAPDIRYLGENRKRMQEQRQAHNDEHRVPPDSAGLGPQPRHICRIGINRESTYGTRRGIWLAVARDA
jgi:hypothetical protein